MTVEEWMDIEAVRTVGREPHGSADDVDLLDFSANTNPLVPTGVREVFVESFDAARRYPVEPPTEFRETAAAYVDCAPRHVVPTPGGLAAIRLAIEVTVEAGDEVLVPAPSFGEYGREVGLQGADPNYVAHDDLLTVDPDDYALVVVCNPNNPTGDAYDDQDLRAYADRCHEVGTPLLVDEAFLGFTDRPSLAGTDGVVVARALTKLFGLPGVRAGFAASTGDLREALLSARRTWNVGTAALAVGTACMRDDAFITETRERVRGERERMAEELGSRFDVHPSESPFLLLDVGERDVPDLVTAVRREGVAIRDATTFRDLNSHVRVAVRLPEENDRLLEVLERV